MDVFKYEVDENGVINCFFDLKKARDSYNEIPQEIKNEMSEKGVLSGQETYYISESVSDSSKCKDGFYLLPKSDLFIIRRKDKFTKFSKEDREKNNTNYDYYRKYYENMYNEIKEVGYYNASLFSFISTYDYIIPGCIVFLFKAYEELKDNTLLFKIYPKGLENGIYPSNKVYIQNYILSFRENNYGSYDCYMLNPNEWLYETGDYVKADNVVCRQVKVGEVVCEYKALKDGILERRGWPSEYVFKVYSDENAYIEEKGIYKFEPSISVDSFTKEITIKWCQVSVFYSAFTLYSGKRRIYMSFEFKDGKSFLVIRFYRYKANDSYSFLKVSKGDLFSFLFEDGSIIDYKIQENPYKIDSKNNKYEVKFPLYLEDVEKFQNIKIVQWKFGQSKLAKESILGKLWEGNDYSKYMDSAFNQYVRTFIEVLHKELPNYKIPHREETNTSGKESKDGLKNSLSEPCYVYLMKDLANGYSKIGISNNPEYREHTLQSEKPTIELVCAKVFPSRKVAMAIESSLHSCYDEKHIRGEWFNLDASDIEIIKQTLK